MSTQFLIATSDSILDSEHFSRFRQACEWLDSFTGKTDFYSHRQRKISWTEYLSLFERGLVKKHHKNHVLKKKNGFWIVYLVVDDPNHAMMFRVMFPYPGVDFLGD